MVDADEILMTLTGLLCTGWCIGLTYFIVREKPAPEKKLVSD